MTDVTSNHTDNASKSFLPLPLRLALRELRSGLGGFYVFIMCITLGVAAIAGVQSLAAALTTNLSKEGSAILGGQLEIMLVHREASEAELSWIKEQGEVSSIVTMRAMARVPELEEQRLVEIKAIDNAYPLIGEVKISSGDDFRTVLQTQKDGTYPALAASNMLDQMGLEIGDTFELGAATYYVADIITNEPDRLSGGLGFGPRVMVSIPALRASDLIQPGTLMNWRYRILSDELARPAATKALEDEGNAKFPEAGWRFRNATGAAPGFANNIERFAEFLTLVGITALLVGGIGVSNAVRSFIDSRSNAIATLKSIGARQPRIYAIYLWQVILIAFIGIALGLVLGALIPIIGLEIISLFLPLGGDVRLFPGALAQGAVFGILTALTFAILPLARTESIPVTALFRGYTSEAKSKTPMKYILAAIAIAAALIFMAVYTAYSPLIAAGFVFGSIVIIIFLWLLGLGIMKVARRLPKPRSVIAKLALGNIHRPDALTPHVILSLGLGLTLMVTITLIDRTITQQMLARLPSEIPSFFFVGIQKNEKPSFDAIINELAPDATRNDAPMLRGRIMSVKGIPAAEYQVVDGGEWVLRGDRGLTFSNTLPEAAKLVEGEWWPTDYNGENLVSFKAEEGAELGLEIGDMITVNVLGRNISAKIANFREQEWESLSINFVMVFSPNTFKGAPYPYLSTLTFDHDASDEAETEIMRQVTKQFPSVTTVQVKTVIEEANRLVGQIAWAFRSASAVTIFAAILVLAGALAAGHRHRLYDAVLLKTLGSTRWKVLGAFIAEYSLLGITTAAFAVIAGSVASYLVTAQVMELDFQFDWTVAIITAVISIIVTVGLGLISTWRVLQAKPAQHLRSL